MPFPSPPYSATRSRRRVALGFAAGPVVGALLAAAWTVHADGIKEDNPLTQAMTSSAQRAWNFGSLDQRLDPSTYAKIIGRIGSEIAGPVGIGLLLAVAGIVLAWRWEDRTLRIGWLAVATFAPLVFFNLYYVHNYYLIAVFPALTQFYAQNRMDMYRDQLTKTMRTVLYLTVPISILMFVMAPQVVGVMLEHGKFDEADPTPDC